MATNSSTISGRRTFLHKAIWLASCFCSRRMIEQRLFSNGLIRIEKWISVKGLCLRGLFSKNSHEKSCWTLACCQQDSWVPVAASTKKSLTIWIWRQQPKIKLDLVKETVASTNFVSSNFLRRFLVETAWLSNRHCWVHEFEESWVRNLLVPILILKDSWSTWIKHETRHKVLLSAL